MAEATLNLTQETFDPTVKKDGIVLVDFWAAWCGPCRAFAPVYEAAAAQHTDITFAKVNTEEQRQLAGTFQIQSIPTLMVFRDGILLYAEPGALPAPTLEELIKQVRAVDMAEVRKEVAEVHQKQKV